MKPSVINESLALIWCQHERPLLLRVLASFYQQYRIYIEQNSLSAQSAQQLAHDLKSVAPSCGASELAQFASQLAPPAPLPSATEQAQLIAHLRAVLSAIEADYPQALAGIQQTQKEPLQELRQALEQHNLNALSMFRQWAAEHALNWPAEVISDIQGALDSFDFKQAKHLLNEALNQYGRTQQQS